MDAIEKTRTADESRTADDSRTADNRETVRAFIDALFTKGDLTAIDKYLAEDFLNHDPPVDSDPSREGMRRAAVLFRSAFPDWHAMPDFLVAEDDLVVEHFSASGTQRGEIFGAPATGRTVTLRGINIFRLRDGRIVERWGRLDELGLLRQLGLVPGPA
ncbi:ester cyclase [Kitasatospora sp. NPDC048538]|uniref:ester cyclase n=1 Tax=unclassified Kitasatospora TaxID=2633591 RepID=UPI0033F0A3EE